MIMKELRIIGTTPMCLDTETGELRAWEEGELEQYLDERSSQIEENASKIKPFHITNETTCEEALQRGVTLEEFRQLGLQKIKKLYGKEDKNGNKNSKK